MRHWDFSSGSAARTPNVGPMLIPGQESHMLQLKIPHAITKTQHRQMNNNKKERKKLARFNTCNLDLTHEPCLDPDLNKPLKKNYDMTEEREMLTGIKNGTVAVFFKKILFIF